MIVIVFVVTLLSSALPVQADVRGCGCYCGKMIDPPCSDQACIRACGDEQPERGSSGGSNNDDAAAERLRLERERQRRERAERERVAREGRRREEERRRREEEAAFNASKEEGLRSLKGVTLSEPELKGEGSSAFGLKSIDAADAGLKTISDESRTHGAGILRSPAAQLRCSASLVREGIKLARFHKSGVDEDDIRQRLDALAEQSANAFAMRPVEVDCDTNADPFTYRRKPMTPPEKVFHELFVLTRRAFDELQKARGSLPKAHAGRIEAEARFRALMKAGEATEAKARQVEEREKAGTPETDDDTLKRAQEALERAKEAEAAVEAAAKKGREELDKLAQENEKVFQRPDQLDDVFAEIQKESAERRSGR